MMLKRTKNEVPLGVNFKFDTPKLEDLHQKGM